MKNILLLTLCAFTANAQLPVERTFSAGESQMQLVRGAAPDGAGYLIIDSQNRMIKRFSPSGDYLGIFRSSMSIPDDIVTDHSGRHIVLEGLNGFYGFTVLSPAGTTIFRVQGNGSGDGQFENPAALAIHPSNDIYVADYGNDRIQVFSPDGTFKASFGSSGSGPGQMLRPVSVHVDPAGFIFVIDSGNRRITKFASDFSYVREYRPSSGTSPLSIATSSPNAPFFLAYPQQNMVAKIDQNSGAVIATFTGKNTPAGPLFGPEHIMVDQFGTIVISDSQNHRFVRLSQSFDFISASSPAPSDIVTPWQVATDQSDNVYILDTTNGRVVQFNANGEFVRNYGPDYVDGRLVNSYGMRLGPDGNLYVSNAPNMIKVFGRNGTFLRTLLVAQTPSTMAIDSDGKIYLSFTSRIGIYSPEGTLITMFGTLGSADGQLWDPRGIAVANGNIYVADTENSRIQVFDLNGNFIRKFGTQGNAVGQIQRPTAIEVIDDKIFVLDAWRLQQFDLNGNFVASIHNTNQSFGFCFNVARNKIVLAETLHKRVQILSYRSPQQILYSNNGPITVSVSDAPYTLQASTDSGLPVTFTSSDPTIASVTEEGIVSFHKGGSVNITMSQPGNETYLPATPVVQNFVVTKKPQKIFFGDHVVISEIFGGGGLEGAPYQRDFVELYNPTTEPVDLTNWTLQYASAGGAFLNRVTLNGKMKGQSYYLISLGSSAPFNGNALPCFDLQGNIDISSTSGKLALVKSGATVGTETASEDIVDYVGYGLASHYEGTAPTPQLTRTTSAERKAFFNSTAATMAGEDQYEGNSRDSQNNGQDFITRAPDPQCAGLKGEWITRLPTVSLSDGSFLFPAYSSSGLSVGAKTLATSSVSVGPGLQINPVKVGIGSVSFFQTGNEIYEQASIVLPVTVTNAIHTITFDPVPEKTYGDEPFQLTATTTSTRPIIYASADPAIASIEGSTVTIHAAGQVIIQAVLQDDPKSAVSQNLIIHKAQLSAIANDISWVYGEEGVPFSIRFEGFVNDDGEDVLTESPAVITTIPPQADAGEYILEVGGGTADNYDIVPVAGTLVITPASLTITADNKTRLYGADNPEFTLSYEGFLYDDEARYLGEDGDATIKLFKRPAITCDATSLSPVADYEITLTGGNAPNYTLTLVNGQLSVTKVPLTVTASAPPVTYGFAEPVVFNLQFAGFVNGETEEVITPPVVECDVVATSDVGEYPIRYVGGEAINYQFVFVDFSLVVVPAALNVRPADHERNYGQENPPFTLLYDGFVNGDDESSIVRPDVICEATAESDAGTYSLALSGGSAANYTLNFPPHTATLTVRKAPLIITPDDQFKTYGDANPELTLSFSGFAGSDGPEVLDALPLVSTAATDFSDAGQYPITLQEGEEISDNNYVYVLGEGTLTIHKAPLTIRADDKMITYGDDGILEFTVSYDGFKGADDETTLDNPPLLRPRFPIGEPGTHFLNAGNYTLDFDLGLSKPSDNNYDFVLIPGTLTVNKAVLTATADDQSKLIGEVIPPLTISYSGLKGSAEPCPGCASNLDDISTIDLLPTAQTIANQDSPAGTYPITLAGGFDNNYSIALVSGTLTVTGTPPSIYIMEPADGATNVTTDVVVIAKSQSGASQYTIQLSTTSDFTGALLQQSGSTRELLFTGLQYNTTYYARAKTDLLNTYGEITSFATALLSYVTSPDDDALNVSTEPVITALDTEARDYFIQLATTSDFAGPIIELVGKKNVFEVTGLSFDTRYYTRISTDLTPNVWGPVRSFTTGNVTSIAYVVSPADGEAGVGTSPRIVANEVPGASSYTIELNPMADFSGLSIIETGNKRIVGFKNLAPDTRYFARVSTDLSNDFGPTTSFTTAAGKNKSAREMVADEVLVEGVPAYVIYPNPFRHTVTIMRSGSAENMESEYVLFDLRGREMSRGIVGRTEPLSLGEGLATGVYLLQLKDRNLRVVTVRLVKL